MTEWLVCRDCKRPLRSAEARRTGYGSQCRRKHQPPARRRRAPAKPPRLPATTPRAPDELPGQDALPLFYPQATLDSL